jgi:single-strand DNA-binding protein
MNKVFLSGNLTRDPEVKYTPSGKAVSKMGIAVNRRFKNPETGQADVDFFNLTAWEKTAEFCGRYLKKGSRVLVEGSLRTYTYTGQDGSKRSGVDILVENIEFANSKRIEEGTGENFKAKNSSSTGNADFDEDFAGEEISDEQLPF